MTIDEFREIWESEAPLLSVQTSGSTGIPKTIWVEKARMRASARMTCDFLNLKQGNTALLCLPVDYIAGKMMLVRAWTCGLQLLSVPPSSTPLVSLQTAPDFAAMVPAQVYQSLTHPLLAQIRHLIIGGGFIHPALEERLRTFPNNIWSTYGMTETLSHIALRRVSGQGASAWYTPLPHVRVWLDERNCLCIEAPQVCASTLATNDVAEINTAGQFKILGRLDNVVCSGGIKLHIEQIEKKMSVFLNSPFALWKTPDVRWGEKLVLFTEDEDLQTVEQMCKTHLDSFEIPKEYRHITKLPLTPTGKIARKQLPL